MIKKEKKKSNGTWLPEHSYGNRKENQKADIKLSFIFTSTGPWWVLTIDSDGNDHKAIEEALGDPDLQGKVTNAVNEHFSHETLRDVRNVLLEILVVNPVKQTQKFISLRPREGKEGER